MLLSVLALLPSWLSADGLIKAFGSFAIYGVMAVIFAVGMFTATGVLPQPLWLSLVLVSIAAIVGNMTGYWLGASVGPRIFTRDSRFFRPEYVDRTSAFFERYGNRAIVFARFVPIVRTIITALAGVGHMDRNRFLRYSTIGGILWVIVNGLLGFWLGSVAFVRNNLEVSLVLIVIVSTIPIIVEARRMRRDGRTA